MANTSAQMVMSAAVSSVAALGNFGGNKPLPDYILTKNPAFTGIGSGVGNFNVSYIATRSVANGTPDTIDLSGSLKQPDGVTAAVFTDVCGIMIANNGAAAISVGGGTNPVGFFADPSDIIVIKPGMTLALGGAIASGYAVTNSSSDIITVTSASGTVSYDIAVIGH